MTQHTETVKAQAHKLEQERQDNLIKTIEVRPGRIQTWYQSGDVVTEYPRDKRKKTTTDNRGIK